jgi:hypothetical protein
MKLQSMPCLTRLPIPKIVAWPIWKVGNICTIVVEKKVMIDWNKVHISLSFFSSSSSSSFHRPTNYFIHIHI